MTEKKQAEKCAARLHAIAELHRIRIIDCLRVGPMNVTQLAKELEVEIVNVSHHLSVLRSAGHVEDVKEGRYVVYSLSQNVFKNDSFHLGWCKVQIRNN
jgi:ArsR family transcriptional regulator